MVELIEQTRSELDELYRQDMSRDTMRHAKQQQLEVARERYQALRGGWQNDPGYDAWFAGELNNARLGSVSAYHTYVDAFLVLLAEENHNFDAFYTRVAEISELDAPARREYLVRLSME